MVRQRFLVLLLLLFLLAGSPVAAGLAADAPVVRAVLFWMDSCPHCHIVIDNVLPPLQAGYGEQLEIRLIEIRSAAELDQLYELAAAVGLRRDATGVPLMLIGDAVLVGSVQIPAELPGLVERHLLAGGVGFPSLPELTVFMPELESALMTPLPAAENTSIPAAAGEVSGFVLAVAILAAMVLVVLYAAVQLATARLGRRLLPRLAWLERVVPALAVAGLAVAAYLAYVETQAVAAVCGPVDDCNTVQTSEYAYLAGIPIGVLGLAGYLAILAVWAWGRRQGDVRATLLFVAMTGAGVLFSIYLTYLEPFVIRAVCAWCLTSAVIMALLLLASVESASRQLAPQPVRRRRRGHH
jgi:uncharacterized membrane protein